MPDRRSLCKYVFHRSDSNSSVMWKSEMFRLASRMFCRFSGLWKYINRVRALVESGPNSLFDKLIEMQDWLKFSP